MSLARLREALAEIPEEAHDVTTSDRHGAVLVLLERQDDGDVRLTFTRRQAHLSSHPGQISFPGGRIDPGETIEVAALREAAEEVGLRSDTVEILGRLPSFYIPPSRFWMTAVVALWRDPHELTPNTAEVAEVLHVPVARLRDATTWRVVPLSASGRSWAWQLGPGRLLWGATAVVTAVLLEVMDPAWSEGARPESLPAEREVRPWEDPIASGIAPASARTRQRLAGIPEGSLPVGDEPRAPVVTPDSVVRAVRTAATSIDRRGDGPVVVLAGAGRAGDVGRAVAASLEPVVLLDVHRADGWDLLTDTVAAAGLLVDAIGDRHEHGLVDVRAERAVRSLQLTSAPIIAVDLPSGIDPAAGVSGPAVSADVTLAVGDLVPAHTAPGTLPFVGDLYVVEEDGRLFRVRPADRSRAWGE